MKAEEIQKIDEFIQGEITYPQLIAYAESVGLTNVDEKIEWVRNAGIAIEADGVRHQLKDLIAKTEDKGSSNKEARVLSMKPIRWVIGIAASALVLVTGYWALFQQDGMANQYAAYEYVDPGLPVVMSQSSNYALYDALSYYSEENYKKTIEKLLILQDEGESSDTILFYLGASQLYNQDPHSAQTTLNSVLEYPDSKFIEKTEWLLVMCALKENDTALAKSQLNKIANNANHLFNRKALDLQKTLDQK